MKPDCVLLDVDGTLVDSNDAHARAWVDAFTEAGIGADLTRIRSMIGMGGDRLLETFGFEEDREPGKSIAARRSAIFTANYAPQLRPTRGARALLERLHSDGIRLVVATAGAEKDVELLLRAAGVSDLFDARATKDDAKETKPAPDILTAALRKAGVDVDQAVMIGDTPYDCQAAQAIGLRALAVRCGGWREPEIDCDGVYDDPQDLVDRYADSLFGAGRS